jgi:glycosyltransferase involved in cell wall biosynthesis
MPASTRQRRVLIVVQNLPVPFDRRVWLEATTLTHHGYRVNVICPKARGFDRPRERLEGVGIYRYPLPIEAHGKLGFVVEFAWCFAAALLLSLRIGLFGEGFDILHVCNPPETYWPMAWFWRACGKVFLFDHHDLSPEMAAAKFGQSGGLLMSALLLFERLTFAAAQVVITTNESHKTIAVVRGGKEAHDVYVVRSGPDLPRFMLHPANPAWRRGKPHLLVYLGEICKQDGVDHLIRAIRIMKDDTGRRDFHCVLVGGGPYQPAIIAYAKAQGVDEVCTFTGRISDDLLCRVLSSADLAIDPDPKTAWSDQSTMNKIMEYMYFGLPIVAYDLKEARVSAQQAAEFVEANDERAMAKAILALLDDPERRHAMSVFGRTRVRSQLAWEYSVPPLLAAYDRAWRLYLRGRQRQAAIMGRMP